MLKGARTVVKTTEEWRAVRARLLEREGMDYATMKKADDEYRLTPEQQDTWRTVEAITYVLGEDQ
jgi:hypothetical protein